MDSAYIKSEVSRSYHWLGHVGFTELLALHPDYRTHKDQFEYNRENNLFPRTGYAQSESEVFSFIQKYAGHRTLCYSLNPRPMNLRNPRGYPRSAREEDIKISQNLLIDLDFKGGEFSGIRIASAEAFIQRCQVHFQDQNLIPPVKAYTGRGFHLLFAYPPISVVDVPDIAARLRAFTTKFKKEFQKDLEEVELKIDPTQDVRRMIKIYGTAKPQVGILSRFYGQERQEDRNLREHLLSLQIEPTSEVSTSSSSHGLQIREELPQWFQSLIYRDEQIRAIWSGEGKSENLDTTPSGYDFSLVRQLLRLGYRDLDDLATILAIRPEGGTSAKGKEISYIKRTLANALLK